MRRLFRCAAGVLLLGLMNVFVYYFDVLYENTPRGGALHFLRLKGTTQLNRYL